MEDWKRTGNNEFPEEDQLCLIYFKETGYSISRFSWDKFVDGDGNIVEELGKVACFSDKGGYLGDEDVLWLPMPKVPDSYKNDKRFKRWNDPEKIYRYVEMIEDYHYVRNPQKTGGINYFELDIPKGSRLGIISDRPWQNEDGHLGEGDFVYQCVWNDGENLHLVYIAPEKVKEIV
jgi:hypothetical protein